MTSPRATEDDLRVPDERVPEDSSDVPPDLAADLLADVPNLDDFATAVRHAVAAGGDADTLAAIVGGIVAARVGLEGIPERWRAAVEPLPACRIG